MATVLYLLTFIWYFITSSAQTFSPTTQPTTIQPATSIPLTLLYNSTNPPPAIVTCGLQTDCDVTCYGYQSCRSITFYFYNNDINLTCHGQTACYYVTIYVINATSLNLYTSGGNWAFHKSALYASGTAQNIKMICTGSTYSCQVNDIILSGKEQNLEIFCKGSLSCNKLFVDAVQAKSLTIHCEGNNACYTQGGGIYAPADPTSIVTINVYRNSPQDEQMHIYSLYASVNFLCTAACTTLNGYFMMYGVDMTKYCEASDTNCLNESLAYRQSMLQMNIATEYVQYISNFGQVDTSNKDHLTIFLAKNAIFGGQTLQMPIELPSTHVISLITISNGVMNFSLSQNASLHAKTASGLTIFGPQNTFTRTSYSIGSSSTNNMYYMNQTKHVHFLCGGISGGACLKSSKLFLGNIENAFIGCGNQDCSYSDIYINDNPYFNELTKLDIKCLNNSQTTCVDLFIHFQSTNFICQYNSSSTLASCNHTNIPTTSPTIEPTIPTIEPTINPTRFPTSEPTVEPTLQPSFQPSSPTIEPTTTPTGVPTIEPTTNPTNVPTEHPTISLTNNPTTFPSYTPSRHPSQTPILSVPSTAPTTCLSNVDQVFNTSTFDGWNKKASKSYPSSTFTIANSAHCYVTNPCIHIIGIDPHWKDFENVYIERTMDVSSWDTMIIHINAKARQFESGENAFVELFCDSQT
eukprot:439458_1